MLFNILYCLKNIFVAYLRLIFKPEYIRFLFLFFHSLEMHQLLYGALKFSVLKGFEKIIRSPYPKCLSCIFKVTVSSEIYKLYFRIKLHQLFPKLQPVHLRHSDVRDHQIRFHLSGFFQRFCSVCSLCHDLAAYKLPVGFLDDSSSHKPFIVYYHYSDHISLFFYFYISLVRISEFQRYPHRDKRSAFLSP